MPTITTDGTRIFYEYPSPSYARSGFLAAAEPMPVLAPQDMRAPNSGRPT